MANAASVVPDPTRITVASAIPLSVEKRRALPLWFRVFISSPLTAMGVTMFGFIVLAALFSGVLARHAPLDMIGPLGSAPSGSNFFGTNDQGQDIFSQVVYGARFSLVVGLGAGIAITITSTVIGMMAAYAGGWVDDILSMIMNIFLVIPQLPLLVAIAAYVPFSGSGPAGAAVTMVIVITITGWAWGARVVRAQTLTLRSRDFVQAAIVVGEPRRRVIYREIMPNMVSLLANTLILSTMGSILTEAALDYLGIGNISQVTWGTMLNKAQANSALFSGEWWSFVFPGLAIALTAMSLILMNYGVDLVSNPQLRVGREHPRRWLRRSPGASMTSAGEVEPAT